MTTFKIMDGDLCYSKGYKSKDEAGWEITRIQDEQEEKIAEEKQVLEDINNMTIVEE